MSPYLLSVLQFVHTEMSLIDLLKSNMHDID